MVQSENGEGRPSITELLLMAVSQLQCYVLDLERTQIPV